MDNEEALRRLQNIREEINISRCKRDNFTGRFQEAMRMKNLIRQVEKLEKQIGAIDEETNKG